MNQIEENETYVVRYVSDGTNESGAYVGGCLVLVLLWLALGGIWLTGELRTRHGFTREWWAECGIIAVIAVVGLVCYRSYRKPIKAAGTISVERESFTCDDGMGTQLTYRFSDINCVKEHHAYVRGIRFFYIGPQNWSIYVGDKQVAVFTKQMENSEKLKERLVKQGFILVGW